jgi:cytidylate kinase
MYHGTGEGSSLSVPDVITVDGPSASGKSTIARQVAKLLDRIYVESGSLYRGVTWAILRAGEDPSDRAAVSRILDRLEMQFFLADNRIAFTVDGVDPGDELRSEQVRENVSVVAAIPEVRERIVAWLRQMLSFGSLVMEGRDIGSAVFPAAFAKFYLDASPDERARRRHEELRSKDGESNLAEVRSSLARRDEIDSHRALHPLTVPDGAEMIDTTHMSIEDVAGLIAGRATRRSAPGSSNA